MVIGTSMAMLTKAASNVRIQHMSAEQVPLLIMTGVSEKSEPERMVSQARQAATLDLVERALSVPALQPVIVSTNSPLLAAQLSALPVQVELDPPDEPFHFGQRLQALIRAYSLSRCFYIGGGAGPLLSVAALADIAHSVATAEHLLVTNNFYSSDLAAFTPTSALDKHPLPASDNELAWLLGEDAGLPIRELPRSGATLFDIDTPTDLLTLHIHPHTGPHTRAAIEGMNLDITALEAALPFMLDRDATILIAGRVGAATWQYVERETACSTRVFSEERGMRASGRQERGEVRSLLAYTLDIAGMERFFTALGTLADAIFLDNRVIFAHRGLWPSAADRFYSDLRCPDQVDDPFVRELTQAAMDAPVPVIMGGHSLVAGGLYALVEAAWARGHDVPRHVVPDVY